MRALIDTNVYSDAMRGEEKCVSLLQTVDAIVLSPVVLGELLFGFRRGGKERKNREELSQFLASSRVSVVPLTETTADFFALVVGQLKDDGIPIPSNDVWIAASAMEHGAYLASKDAHFEEIKGLLLWNG